MVSVGSALPTPVLRLRAPWPHSVAQPPQRCHDGACPTRRRLLNFFLPLLQPTRKEMRMLRAARDDDLAAVQALLAHDRALARCKEPEVCYMAARMAPRSGTLWERR